MGGGGARRGGASPRAAVLPAPPRRGLRSGGRRGPPGPGMWCVPPRPRCHRLSSPRARPRAPGLPPEWRSAASLALPRGRRGAGPGGGEASRRVPPGVRPPPGGAGCRRGKSVPRAALGPLGAARPSAALRRGRSAGRGPGLPRGRACGGACGAATSAGGRERCGAAGPLRGVLLKRCRRSRVAAAWGGRGEGQLWAAPGCVRALPLPECAPRRDARLLSFPPLVYAEGAVGKLEMRRLLNFPEACCVAAGAPRSAFVLSRAGSDCCGTDRQDGPVGQAGRPHDAPGAGRWLFAAVGIHR